MTIAEASRKYGLSADALRYYERVGIIPRVPRTKSGIRDYDEASCGWIELTKCLRSAGVQIEALIQYSALFQQGGNEELPLPGQGAGLGLPIARHIVALHKGSLLVEWGQSAPSVVLSLPTGPLDGRVSVHTPTLQRDGGLDPVLTELSDLLPPYLFGMEGLD